MPCRKGPFAPPHAPPLSSHFAAVPFALLLVATMPHVSSSPTVVSKSRPSSATAMGGRTTRRTKLLARRLVGKRLNEAALYSPVSRNGRQHRPPASAPANEEMEENIVSNFDNLDYEIEYEYDRFTRRAALASIGLWGFLTSNSIRQYLDYNRQAEEAMAYLDSIAVKWEAASRNGLPTLISFHRSKSEVNENDDSGRNNNDIRKRLARPIQHVGGPKKINYVPVQVEDYSQFALLGRYDVYTTPTLVWVDAKGKPVGTATGDLPEGLIEVNTNSLIQGDELPYASTILPGADIIDDPVYNALRSRIGGDEIFDNRRDGGYNAGLDELPSPTPMELS